MNEKVNCLICGAKLKYSTTLQAVKCMVCQKYFDSMVSCEKGHYVCDNCHSKDALGLIKTTCLTTETTEAFGLASHIMNFPAVKMHGPEHHFLVPAVLLTCYHNYHQSQTLLNQDLDKAAQRSKNILGGFCGFYGACGAAIGTGIFLSIISNTTPLSEDNWGKCNQLTAKSLSDIAACGGPRCCKRDTFLALEQAIEYLANHFDTRLPKRDRKYCSFHHLNKDCIQTKCPFYS